MLEELGHAQLAAEAFGRLTGAGAVSEGAMSEMADAADVGRAAHRVAKKPAKVLPKRKRAKRQPVRAPAKHPCSVEQRRHVFATPGLSNYAKLLAILILDLMALSDGACTMSRHSIAIRLGAAVQGLNEKGNACVSRGRLRTLEHALKELVAIGWLKTKGRGRGNPAARWIELPQPEAS